MALVSAPRLEAASRRPNTLPQSRLGPWTPFLGLGLDQLADASVSWVSASVSAWKASHITVVMDG